MLEEPVIVHPIGTKTYHLIGGTLCLDFCNSMGGKREGVPREYLHSYPHFLEWCEQAGVLTSSQNAALNQMAIDQPNAAAGVLTRALEFREASYRTFLALAGKSKPSSDDVARINMELAYSLSRLQVSPEKDNDSRFTWRWNADNLDLGYPLGPIAHSAANLLVSQNCCAHVHQCRGDNCGWLFIDYSKNHSRCWCDMRDCGNRAKVRRHRTKNELGG